MGDDAVFDTASLLQTEEAREYLFATGSGAASSGAVNSKVDNFAVAASAHVSRWCDRKFLETTYTDILYDGNGLTLMQLRNWPITVGTVTLYEDTATPRAWGADTLLTDGTDYLVKVGEQHQGDIERINSKKFPACGQSIKVTYTAGYTLVNMPTDVKHAVKRLVAAMWRISEGGADVYAAKSVIAGGGSVNYLPPKGMPEDVAEILRPWRRAFA